VGEHGQRKGFMGRRGRERGNTWILDGMGRWVNRVMLVLGANRGSMMYDGQKNEELVVYGPVTFAELLNRIAAAQIVCINRVLQNKNYLFTFYRSSV
jgi:hypothetical protein